MKKIIIMMIMAIIAGTTVNAQSIAEMAKQRKSDNKAIVGMKKSEKPNSEAKKRAKQLTKEGYKPVGSGAPLQYQIMEDLIMHSTPMEDEDGDVCLRYIESSTDAVAGDMSTASAMARNACQEEVGSLLETKITAAMEHAMDNSQLSAFNAESVNKFHERSRAIMSATLTNGKMGMKAYRVLKNGKVQVQQTVFYDKKDILKNLAKNIAKELEMEGNNEINGIVKSAISEIE